MPVAVTFFIPHMLLPFQSMAHSSPKMQLSDITKGSLSDNMQLPPEPQKALYICSSISQDL